MRILKIPGVNRPVPTDLIVWLEGDSNYTHIHFSDGTKCLACETLKWFKSHLEHFIRIHKSGLVNPVHVSLFDQLKCDQAWVILSNGTKLAISRRRIKKVTQHLRLLSTSS